jgi:Protein phosphatase 2C
MPGDNNNSRLYVKGKDYPGLPVSRIIGFSNAHAIGASA